MIRMGRMIWALVLLFTGSGVLGAQENRLWWVDAELEGPLREVVLDCGPAGHTILETDLVAGERRTLSVPVPARVPLGVDSLAGHPLPVLTPEGAGAASLRGWSDEQPVARVDALVGLRSRPRPPVERAPRGPGPAASALACAAFVVGLGLRRRPRSALAVGGLGLVVVVALGGAAAEHRGNGVRLVEADAFVPLGLVVTGNHGELPLPRARLEVRPEGRPLELRLRLESDRVTGTVRAPEAELYGLDTGPGPDLAAGAWRGQAWVRDAEGVWSGHDALGSAPEGPPPGWLTAGLPPGRSVLVGRLATGDTEEWIRLVGFLERD